MAWESFKNRRRLKGVTLICVDCSNYDNAIKSMSISMSQCKFDNAIFITDQPIELVDAETIIISKIKNKHEYSHFMIKELSKYIKTSHFLVVQHDGCIIDGEKWSDHYLNYDYIGATWTGSNPFKVGNGGFSLRSRRLHEILASDQHISKVHPEDEIIGRTYRQYLQDKYDIKFAPDDVARMFSHEKDSHRFTANTFGFHDRSEELREIRKNFFGPRIYENKSRRLAFKVKTPTLL